jgi:hypothetical protein
VTPTRDLIPLNEEVWRNWLHKGRLREQAHARRRKRAAGIVIALAAIAFAVIRLLGRP